LTCKKYKAEVVVKKVVMICSVVVLQALSSLGDTNAAPSTAQAPVSKSAVPPQKPVAKANPPANTTTNPDQRDLSHESMPPARMFAVQHAAQEHLLIPAATNDYNAELNEIFWPGNDQAGETEVRNTIVTIFPTGH
jgi:hypothetical protein